MHVTMKKKFYKVKKVGKTSKMAILGDLSADGSPSGFGRIGVLGSGGLLEGRYGVVQNWLTFCTSVLKRVKNGLFSGVPKTPKNGHF